MERAAGLSESQSQRYREVCGKAILEDAIYASGFATAALSLAITADHFRSLETVAEQAAATPAIMTGLASATLGLAAFVLYEPLARAASYLFSRDSGPRSQE